MGKWASVSPPPRRAIFFPPSGVLLGAWDNSCCGSAALIHVVLLRRCRRVATIVVLWPGNAHGPATLCIGSVKFRTVGLGGAFLNGSCGVPCVLSDALVLRRMMFMFRAKEADLGMMALVAYPGGGGVRG